MRSSAPSPWPDHPVRRWLRRLLRRPAMADPAELRQAMVERQLQGRGIGSAPVLAAMSEIPREAFVPDRLRERSEERRVGKECRSRGSADVDKNQRTPD